MRIMMTIAAVLALIMRMCEEDFKHITHTLQFSLTGPLFQSFSRLVQSPKINFWELLWQYFLQARCHSCQPTETVKAL